MALLQRLGDRPATADEQVVLAGWSSWGAVPQVFDTSNADFRAEREQLQRMLDTAAYNAAARTTINAHYTDPQIAEQMWDLLSRLGIPAHARVLEPGCGSGNFIGHAPQPFVHLTGVELDPTSAAIAAKLYPSATIRAESFADTRGLDGFDAVIGNVPFGDVHLHDAAYNTGRHSIHNHFIVKSLAMTNPGGLVAVLTSRHTLDSSGTAARTEMAGLADLVAAVRLPSGAHQRTAGTDVVTDLLLFRRHSTAPHPDRAAPQWLSTTPVDLDGHTLRINDYLLAHPEHVLGQLGVKHGQHVGELTVHGEPDYLPALWRTLSQVAEDADRTGQRWQAHHPAPVARPGGRPAGFLGHLRANPAGGLEQAVGPDTWQSVDVPASQVAETTHLLQLRDLYVDLLTADAASSVDTTVNRELRGQLNDAYDTYLARYGPINRYTETPTRRRGRGSADRTDGGVDSRDEAADEAGVTRRYPPAVTRFRQDPHAVYVLALEVFDERTHTAQKAAILHGRVLVARTPKTRADNPADALALTLDRHGHVDPTSVADLLGLTAGPDAGPDSVADGRSVVERARDALGDLVYDEPGTDRLVPAGEYLSGRVRDKLKVAVHAAQTDPRYARNVTDLRAVVPADLEPGEIKAALGATWIGASDVEAFLRDTLRDPQVSVTHDAVSGWKVAGGQRWTVQATEEWGTSRMAAHKITQHLLNQLPIRITDETPDGARIPNHQASAAAREKGTALNAEFARWAWDEPQRAVRLAAHYNDLFNGLVLRRDYRRGPMALPGLALSFTPAPHQLNAVARAIQEPSTGIFHPVGFGKTAEMVMAIMEQKRLGLVNKPALVVPNHMLEQAQREFLQLYPAARVVAASSDDLARDRRRAFVAKVTNGDWDAVIMTRGAFAALPVSAEELRRYLEAEVRPLREAFEAQRGDGNPNSRSVKQAEKALLELEERIKARLDSQRDVGVTFEQTGIDYVCIDELHDFKNLTTPSRIPGAGIAAGSRRATDLHQKVAYLRREHRGRAILGATATPISNSVSEVYVMLRHLRPDLLTDAGITTFDGWAATFGQTVTSIELAPAGQTFRETTRFARFQNVPELLTMWSAAGDTLDPATVDLPRPQLVARPGDGQRVPQAVRVPASEQLLALSDTLAERARRIKDGAVTPDEDNMLKITSEGRLAALDLRLTPQYRDQPPPPLKAPTKADVAAATIHKIWAEHTQQRFRDPRTGAEHPRPGALQLVFCDLGTPKTGTASAAGAAAFSVYDDLRAQLVDRGVPAGQIAFTHSARNDAEKGRLFERARTGEVQVLIGSTQTMGVGTNVQTRAVALHHLDCPWKPSEMEQREGRILRQGNQHPEVAIYRYATERSFDGYMYQTVARKGAFIDQVMSGRVDVREIDDISSSETLSYEEMQAAVSGNPYLREKQQLAAEVAQLELLARSHREAERSLGWKIADLQRQRDHLSAAIPQIQADAAVVTSTRGEAFRLDLDGRTYTDRTAAGQALTGRLNTLDPYAARPTLLGSLGGRPLYGERVRDGYGQPPYARVTVSEHAPPVRYAASELAEPAPTHVVRLENAVASLPERCTTAKASLDEVTDQLQRATQRRGQAFPHSDRLDVLKHRQAEVEQAITALARGTETPPGSADASDAGSDADLADAQQARDLGQHLDHPGRPQGPTAPGRRPEGSGPARDARSR